MKNKLLSVFFCLLLASITVVSALTPDKAYSENEKRTLEQKPKISFSRFVSGKLSDEIESYLSDQFPARDGWITVKTLSLLALGKREISNVFFSKDGYLIDGFDSFDEANFKKNVETLKALSEKFRDGKVKFNVMLVPTKAEILFEKLPPFSENVSQKKLSEYVRASGLSVVDCESELLKHKDEYIYYKTDHHYTSLGAYYCYVSWKNAKGEKAEPLNFWQTKTLSENFRGTSYSKVNFPFAAYDTVTAYYKNVKHKVNYNSGNYVTDSIYETKYLGTKDQYATFLNSNQALTVVNGGGKGKLLIIKDSYANCFSQFVVDDYAQTHLIDPRFFKGSIEDYVKKNKIDEVLVLYNIPNFTSDTSFGKLCS